MKLLAFIVLELALAVPAFAQAPAAPPAAAPASDAVVRAVFTTAVADREPADQITSLKNDVPQVYFYTELIDLEGQSVTHKWEYAGEVKAEVRFDVKAPRWRVWSSSACKSLSHPRSANAGQHSVKRAPATDDPATVGCRLGACMKKRSADSAVLDEQCTETYHVVYSRKDC